MRLDLSSITLKYGYLKTVKSTKNGNCIYATNSKVILSDFEFSDYEKNCFYSEETFTLLNNTIFRNSPKDFTVSLDIDDLTSGHAMYIFNSPFLKILNSKFINNTGAS